MGRNVAWGEMSQGETSRGEMLRGETSFGEKRRIAASFIREHSSFESLTQEYLSTCLSFSNNSTLQQQRS